MAAVVVLVEVEVEAVFHLGELKAKVEVQAEVLGLLIVMVEGKERLF